MKTVLIIAEKPAAAAKIAEALAEKKATKKLINKIAHYELEHKNQKILVGCAVGHLYTLAEKNRKAWHYPLFDYEWKQSSEVSKDAKFSKAYVDALAQLAKETDNYIIATDLDPEGDVIGYNIVRFIFKKNDARRMKFSTLTKDELIDSYEHASPHLDFPQIESGLTRHSLDFLWGLNLSRALTLSIKHATGMFKLLSTGRVQGPTLKILCDREKEIKAFISEPYSELELIGEAHTQELHAWHKTGKFWKKEEAEAILKKTRRKDATVSSIEKKSFKHKPPVPFDLTSLQIEAYSTLGLSPQITQSIAQDLYTGGYISYPRTSSQKLPPALNYKKILQKLQRRFSFECDFLLKREKLVPHEGPKTDPAHPSVHPTGELPSKLEGRNAKLYELIVRRFLVVFGDEATRETMTITLDVEKEPFVAKGTRTLERG